MESAHTSGLPHCGLPFQMWWKRSGRLAQHSWGEGGGDGGDGGDGGGGHWSSMHRRDSTSGGHWFPPLTGCVNTVLVVGVQVDI